MLIFREKGSFGVCSGSLSLFFDFVLNCCYFKNNSMRNFHFIAIMFALLVGGAMGVSCKKHKTSQAAPKITLSEPELFIRSAGETSTITIEATQDWVVGSNSEWCRASVSGGKAGTSTIELMVAPLSEGEYDGREAIVSFTIGKYGVELKVTQRQRNAIIVSSKLVELTSLEHLIEVEVQSNIDVSLSVSGAWITFEPEAETVPQALTKTVAKFWVTANFSEQAREGYVVFTNEQLQISDTLTVRQGGANLYSLDEFMALSTPGAYFTKDSARLYDEVADQMAINAVQRSFRLQNYMQSNMLSIILDSDPELNKTVVGKLVYRVPPKKVLSNETITLTVVAQDNNVIKLWSKSLRRGFIVRTAVE